METNGRRQAQQQLAAERIAEACAVPGLSLLPDFVSAEEETAILKLVDAQQHWESLARRRVLHCGRKFDYASRGLGGEEHPLPPLLRSVARRIEAATGSQPLDQLTVNEYTPGVGISPHVETHSAFTGSIASLSLAGPAAMVLRREGHPQRAVFLPPRSLLMLSGEARYCWQHYIPHRKSDAVAAAQAGGEAEVVPRAARRVSLTFRTARGFPCDCAYPEYCDSQLAPLEPTRLALKRLALEQQQQAEQEQQQQQGQQQDQRQEQQRERQGPAEQQGRAQLSDAGESVCSGTPGALRTAEPAAPRPGSPGERQLAAIEAQHVHSVYDAIAPHFAATRFAVWPRVRSFLDSLPRSALLADVGCGNGKYFGVRRDAFVLGSDRSEGLASVAARRLQPPPCGEGLRADVAVADGLALPYRPGSCDAALCIAVLHHLASPARRLTLLAQLLRVLRPGGRALVTVWATQQSNMRKVRSWQPVDLGGGGGGGSCVSLDQAPAGAAAEQREGSGAAGLGGGVQEPGGGTEAGADQPVASGDYFVPWHVPFHRADAAAAARHAGASEQPPQGAEETVRSASSEAPAAGGAGAAAPRVDGRKGAVVFQRYYHLFAEGELDALVARLPGAALVDSFYDRDNWCCVFQRCP